LDFGQHEQVCVLLTQIKQKTIAPLSQLEEKLRNTGFRRLQSKA